jgi:hypothetical protein
MSPNATPYVLSLPVDHPTSVVFLDETGVVHRRATDRFFGIGCLKARDPSGLLLQLRALRDTCGYRGELHWARFDKADLQRRDDVLQLACDAIDLVFDSDDAYFACSIANRDHGDLTARFRHHAHPGHKAYEALAAQVLADIVDERELITVLADHMTTHRAVHFEADVARAANNKKQRLAVASVCRVDSRCTDGLQLIDLLLGAAAFDLRQGHYADGETQKQRLLGHLLDRCGCASFRPNGRRDAHGAKFEVKILTRATRTHRGRRG